MELAIAALSPERQARYSELMAAAETAPLAQLEAVCEELQVRVVVVRCLGEVRLWRTQGMGNV
jgi:hypothetical protein